jgi:hypothetical protein
VLLTSGRGFVLASVCNQTVRVSEGKRTDDLCRHFTTRASVRGALIKAAAWAAVNTASLSERVQQLKRLVYLLVFVVVVIPLLQWLIR